MKANELMIGDWVYYKDKEQMPCRVISISRNSIRFDNGTPQDWMSDVKNFTPIPLTAEILEKIGFVRFYVNYVNYWKMQVDNVYIELRPTEGNMAIWLDYDKDNDGIYANYILPYPDNLHQLQHALRLCNIDKEIEL
jgi:hypothetical protein